MVLTGEETGWIKNAGVAESNAYYHTISNYYRYSGLCSHYKTVRNVSEETGIFFGNAVHFLTNLSDEIDTVDKWKSYLAAQYAAGTPVTVWYVLAEPETGIVNEPLCKIGDYADELTDTIATLPEIPTTTGQNTLTVDTELQPSEMTITYRE